jgi:hypothetical protein
MTPTAKALLAYLIVALVVFTWLMRIDAKPTGTGFFYVTDRWLGRVYFCGSGQCATYYPPSQGFIE